MPTWTIQKMELTVVDPPQPAPNHVTMAPAAGWEQPRSFESLKITVAGRERGSQVGGTFEIGTTGKTKFTDDPLFLYKEFVRIYRDGSLFFQGSVTMTPREAGPQNEGVAYTVSDVWWWMERVFVQMQAQSGENDLEMVRRFMGEHTDEFGNPMRTNDHFEQIIAQAQGHGIPIAKGVILNGIRVIRYDFSGSLAEAFKQILQWHPDAVIWIDHGAQPLPTINIQKRSSLAAVNISVEGRPLSSINIKARPDLRPDCFRIVYAKKENGRRTYEVDEAMIGSPLPPVTCMTIDLNTHQEEEPGGVEREYLVQELKTRNVPADGDTGDNTKKWWIQRIPGLKKYEGSLDLSKLLIASADDVIDANSNPPKVIERHETAFADDNLPDPPADPKRPRPVPGAQPHDYPQELVKGQIQDWMNIRQRTMVSRATLAYEKATIEAIADDKTKAAFKTMFPLEVQKNNKTYLAGTWSTTFEGTNGTTKVYRALKSITITEPNVPVDGGYNALGLAQKFRDAMAELHFDGTIELTEREVGNVDFLGKVINIPDGRPEWAGMNALVQQVSEDLQTGITTISIGPPEQVDFQGIQDKADAVPKVTTYTFDYGDSEDGLSDGPIGGYATPVTNTAPDTPAVASGEAAFCPLGYKTQDGNFKIQAGSVVGPNQTILLENDVREPATDSSVDVYVKIGYTVATEDGVLIAGGTLDSAVIQTSNSGADAPNAADPTGAAVYHLGRVVNESGAFRWEGACGNLAVRICPDGATVFRS